MSDEPQGYRRDGPHRLIEIRLRSVAQLFNSLDPSPFHEKDLDHDAETYLVGAVRDFPLATPLRLVVQLPADQLAQAAASLPQALEGYFAGREARCPPGAAGAVPRGPGGAGDRAGLPAGLQRPA